VNAELHAPRRVLVMGDSCSGKSTLGATLAERLGVPFIELDALFWQPNWQEPDPDQFRADVRAAVAASAGWVVSGNYRSRLRDITWPVADTVAWLDFPLWRTIPRIIARSWRRSRSHELLWGTNSEKFWPQLKLWDPKESLIAFSLRTSHARRREMLAASVEGASSGQHWFRLQSPREVDEWLAAVTRHAAEEAMGPASLVAQSGVGGRPTPR